MLHFGSYGMKITGEEYFWDCIKENVSNMWVTPLEFSKYNGMSIAGGAS